jgi:hypothetical protein
MRVLLANLKHLYQRRSLWIVYAGLALVVWFLVVWVLLSPTEGRDLFGGFLLSSFLLGLLVAALQMETSSKPFSFCLPGHRDAVRRLVFLVGLVVSLAFLLVYAAVLASPSFAGPWELHAMAPELLVLLAGSCLCASVTAYLLGAGIAFSVIHGASALGTMTIAVVVCAEFNVCAILQYPIIYWPVAVITLALVMGLAGWWWLGRPAWFRRRCGRPWMGLLDPWDRSQVQKHRAHYATRFTRKIPPGLDQFFQRVIGTRRPSSPGKYAWGVLYTTCVLVAPQWRGLLSLALLAVVYAAYFPPGASFVMVAVFMMMTGFVHPPICTALLVAGGRKERFFATVVLILVLGLVSGLLVGVLVGLTHLLASLAPPVRLMGRTLHPQAISFKVLLVPLALLPIAGLIQTLFYRRPARLALSIMLVLAIIMSSSTPLGWYRTVTPALAVVGTVLSWGICVPILYRIAMRSDLAGR